MFQRTLMSTNFCVIHRCYYVNSVITYKYAAMKQLHQIPKETEIQYAGTGLER